MTQASCLIQEAFFSSFPPLSSPRRLRVAEARANAARSESQIPSMWNKNVKAILSILPRAANDGSIRSS